MAATIESHMPPHARAASAQAADTSLRLVCSEIFGGNRPIRVPVELPGMRGELFSAPCDGGRGGDIHYLSVCGSGLLTRGCIADVAGHGATVSAISGELHGLMRRFMNHPDQRRVLAALNRRVVEMGFRAMTTAIAFTYYPPSGSFSLSAAGHPPAWLFSRAQQTWTRFPRIADAPRQPRATRPEDKYLDLPLGIEASTEFSRHRVHVEQGDRVVMLTDGVLEAPAPGGELFGDARVESVLRQHTGETPEQLAEAMLSAVAMHTGAPTTAGISLAHPVFTHDDVTLFVGDFVAGPRGPAIWHAIRNRLIRARGNSQSAQFA